MRADDNDPASGAALCAFCGEQGTTEEHVFAKWIADVLEGEGTFTLSRAHGRSKTDLRYLGVTSRAPCETCNNTWMSQSEQAVRPLLTPPIQNRPALWTSEEDKATVAAWAMKTALMLDRSVVPSRRTVPDTHFVYLFEHRKPRPSLSVLLGRYLPSEGEVAFSVWSNTAWMTAHPTSTGDESQGFSISFTVGHALFIVTAFADERLVLYDRPVTLGDQPVEDALRRLWPLTPGPYAWPPQGAHFTTSGLDLLKRE